MQVGKTREELERVLSSILDEIESNKDIVKGIKDNLKEYNILGGDVQLYINDPDKISQIDDERFLCLLTNATYIATGDQRINTDKWFTKKEIKLSQQYIPDHEFEEKLEFPLTIDDVIMVNSEYYITSFDIKFIKKLMDSKLLRYNPDTQREGKLVRRRGSIETVPKTNSKSVREIAQHLLKGTLYPTTITLNCLKGKGIKGYPIYDPNKRQLTITEGTFWDILDGFHRISGSLQALRMNPDINFKFQIAITNYNTRVAQKFVAQINTVNKMSEHRKKELEESRPSDTVVKNLQRESILEGKVSSGSRPQLKYGELTTFGILADAIDEVFDIDNPIEEDEVTEDLKKFFRYLIGYYSDEFKNKVQVVNRDSIINSNVMFYGYIVLAKRMIDEGIDFKEVKNIIDNIDFSRDNPMWEEKGILSNGYLASHATRKIKEFFEEIDLKEGVGIGI